MIKPMDITGKKTLTDTPCVGICSTSLGDEVCIGCGRTFDEVRLWNTLSDEQKASINLRLLKEKK
jgi:uncharacterized protein